MKNPSETAPIFPLHVGDMALRFRVEWKLVRDAAGETVLRPFVVGTRAVWIVAVSPSGKFVTWTEGKKKRGGGEYRHTCDRGELLSLDAVAADLCASTSPEKMAGTREYKPARAA